MGQQGIADSAIQLLQTLRPYQELKVLFPYLLVLFELAADTIIKMHDSSLDAVVVSEIGLRRPFG